MMSSYERYVYVETTNEVDEHILDDPGNFECYTLKGATELLNDKQNLVDDLLRNGEYERRMHCKFKREALSLAKENEKLKSKVDDKEVAVEVETEKLMDKVFDLIEEKIKHAQECYADERADRNYYRGQLSILRELKKELEG